MDRITRHFPGVRVLRFGGRDLSASECRLRDYRDLQARLDALWPDPVSATDADRADPALSDAGRDRLLYDAYDAAGDGIPALASEAGAAWLVSLDGVVALCAIAFRRFDPSLSDSALGDAMATATPAEFAALRRTFWGVDPVREAARILSDHLPTLASPGRPVKWAESIAEVAERYHLSDAQVMDMPLSTFRAFRSGGHTDDLTGVEIDPNRTREAVWLGHARRCRAYGLDPVAEWTGDPADVPVSP